MRYGDSSKGNNRSIDSPPRRNQSPLYQFSGGVTHPKNRGGSALQITAKHVFSAPQEGGPTRVDARRKENRREGHTDLWRPDPAPSRQTQATLLLGSEFSSPPRKSACPPIAAYIEREIALTPSHFSDYASPAHAGGWCTMVKLGIIGRFTAVAETEYGVCGLLIAGLYGACGQSAHLLYVRDM